MQTLIAEILSHPWALWILIAVLAGLIELVIPSFSFAFVSGAALIGALVSFKVGLPAQISIFSFALVASIALLRPRLIKRLHSAHALPSRVQGFVGKPGKVTEAIDPVTRSGRVMVEGEDWAACSGSVIAAGSTIVVEGSDGIILLVKRG